MPKSTRGKTDDLLAAAFTKRIKEEPLDKISIKSITDECGLNRQTFYYHFHGIYDLVSWILQREAERVVLAARDSEDVYDCIRTMVKAMDESRALFMAFYSSVDYPCLRQDFMEYLTEQQKLHLSNMLCTGMWTEGDRDFLARIIALVLTEFVEKWHKGLSVNTLDEFVRRFSMFITQHQRGAEAMTTEEMSAGGGFIGD